MTHDAEVADPMALMVDLLENKPLYFTITVVLKDGASLPRPTAVTRYCESCDQTTTWRAASFALFPPGWALEYICARCDAVSVRYWTCQYATDGSPEMHQGNPPKEPAPVRKASTTMADVRNVVGRANENRQFKVLKIGQVPAWSIELPPRLAKALPREQKVIYSKALMCLNHGHGIAAVAYFRRVVDDAQKEILDSLTEALQLEGDDDGLKKLAEARAKLTADERLKLAAELVPASLRPGGVNPLKQLWGQYSIALHSLSDDECLTVAMGFKAAFDLFFTLLSEQLEALKEFRKTMNKPVPKQGS